MSIIRRISFVFFLISFSNVHAQSKCNSVRTGVFYTKADKKNTFPVVTIDRAEFTQFETKGDSTTQYDVHWNDVCEFTLKTVSTESETTKTTVNIIKVRKKYYTAISYINGVEIMRGKFFRTKL
jgi:hypothetical protein